METAFHGFTPIARESMKARKQSLARELSNQQDWINKRAAEITGSETAVAPVQSHLFESMDRQVANVPDGSWQSISDSAERLAAFHADRFQSAAARAEAEGVRRICRKRLQLLKRLSEMSEPEVIPLGVLMLVPEA